MRGRREGLLEEQTVRYQEDTVRSAVEQKNVGTLVYNTECEWEHQARKGEIILGWGGGKETVWRTGRL